MAGLHPELPAAAAIVSIRRGLLRWYRRNARPLPWRADRDPYRVWVSETMLQQTQIAAVIPHHARFLERFPTLLALAAADEAEVLRHWEGLGYYRRARHLHQAAKLVAERHGGVPPGDPEAFAALPGVGRYTLGAVLSIAYGAPLPAVDGNVQRVLARLFLCEEPPGAKGRDAWFWATAAKLVPPRSAGDFNQALMELGQLICLPRRPKCLECPLAQSCAARRFGRTDAVPPPKPAKALTPVREAAVALERNGKTLLARRPDDAERWAGFWEFPHAELKADEPAAEAAPRIAAELAGLRIAGAQEFLTLRHTVTRFRITLHGWRAEARAGAFRSRFYVEHAWVEPEALADYPLSRPQRRLAQAFVSRR